MPHGAPATQDYLEEYEPPAVVSLGSVSELTQNVSDGSLAPSDRLLKQDIEPMRGSLERLVAIRTSRR